MIKARVAYKSLIIVSLKRHEESYPKLLKLLAPFSSSFNLCNEERILKDLSSPHVISYYVKRYDSMYLLEHKFLASIVGHSY
ncbi:unnamed protein product [Brassica rapa]|uniref:Uncharacterized protein n=2 Tax=Brassica TaxID=3705 RepID=A0A3P6C5K9_BRACM|nr:unnamed protein product [Brassica napus]CAG7897048.1 unnamed protein product [Brassica rapa]CDY47316.1 BnaAnng08900D [Brassica napus]VDD03199.1 unnamed protein product [Brassica rapa]